MGKNKRTTSITNIRPNKNNNKNKTYSKDIPARDPRQFGGSAKVIYDNIDDDDHHDDHDDDDEHVANDNVADIEEEKGEEEEDDKGDNVAEEEVEDHDVG